MPRLGLGIRVRCSALPEPVITGTAFPGETLTSTQPGQWQADGVDVSGETGSTYLVRLTDIGRVIRQTRSANSLTIWKPGDIAGVVRFWSSLSNVLNSVSPDVAATNGQTVRRSNGILSGTQADQATGINQPIYRSTGQSGNPSLEFDGSNDWLSLPGNTDIFNGKSQGYLIAGVRDTNPSGGASSHNIALYTVNGVPARIGLYTRLTSANNFTAGGRRQDGDSFVSASAASNSNYNVVATHADWSNGFIRLRVNGAVAASTAYSSGSGNSSSTNSNTASIGADTTGSATTVFPGHITCVCVVNQSITATELSQIERYIGLFGNLNIPLV